MRRCARRPCGPGWLAPPSEPALCPQPGCWGPQSGELRRSWHRSRLWKIREETWGRSSGRSSHQASRQLSSASCPAWGPTAVHAPEGPIAPSETQPQALTGTLASKEAAGLGKQNTTPPAQTKQEGARESFLLRTPPSLNRCFNPMEHSRLSQVAPRPIPPAMVFNSPD